MHDHWKHCRRARDEMGWGGGRGLPHRGGHGFGGRHGGGRGGRMFDHGDLRLVVLSLLAEKPAHGYELIKAIEDKLGGAYSPSPGVIYPTLTLLEELGYAAHVPGEGAKKLYEATAEGRAHLQDSKAQVEALEARMGEAKGRGAPLPVLRAMENLKTALRYRLSSGEVGEAQVRAIAEAIDAAAIAVERA